MTQNSSAGVYVSERDDSQRAVAASTSIGVIVGESNRGPVGERTLVTSTKGFLAKFGKPNARLSYMHHCALAFLEEGKQLYVTRVAPGALFGGASISTSGGTNQIGPIAEGMAKPLIYEFTAPELFMLYAVDPGLWNAELTVYVYPNTRANDGTFFIQVYVQGNAQPVETMLCHLNYMLDGYGKQMNVAAVVNRSSSYIRCVQNEEQSEFRANPSRIFINTLTVQKLFGGGDAVRRATSSDIIGSDAPGGVMGWNLYADPEEVDINILINGGYADPDVQRAMTDLAEARMDCMAILDTPSDKQRLSDALAYRRNELNIDSTYAALYSPDYLVLDEYNQINLYVPPSGHVAACYARTDTEKALWWAPAGMDQGKLSVKGVRETYNLGDRNALTDAQVNATRVIQGSGIRIWGADTLQTMASSLSNVSVRRLMMFIEKSLSEAALYSVFDPNDQVLRNKLTEICGRFLQPIKDAEGVYNYGAQCDDDNNPPEVTAAGDLNLDVFIDPVLPAKRIHLTAIVNKTGARFVQQ